MESCNDFERLQNLKIISEHKNIGLYISSADCKFQTEYAGGRAWKMSNKSSLEL